MGGSNELHTECKEGTIDTAFVIYTISRFIEQKKQLADGKMRVIVLDNARIHHSAMFKSQMDVWELSNVFIFFLPAYSPHLNKIETLWRKIKYEWIKAEDYASYDKLKASVLSIIDQFGVNYNINFKT